MISLFPRASLRRSSRTRTRKDSISVATDIARTPCSSILTRRTTRPPPLQIIPELSENVLVIDVSPTSSPATARPTQFSPQQLQIESSRITLSAYTFSIDDALFMLGNDAPRSPALSASSSTSDGASSEGVPTTPGTSDDEDRCDVTLPVPHLRPQRISIRPLCITKTRSLICQEDEDIHNCFEKEEEEVITPALSGAQPEVEIATAVVEESEQDFYTREFEDFISLSPVVPSHSSPARRDSLILVADALPITIEVPEPKPRGRSRHSKPLPLLPPATLPVSLPSIPHLVQTTAHTSVVRRKRNIPPFPNYPPPPAPVESRPLPRMTVPEDIEDCVFPEEDFDIPTRETIVIEQVHGAEEYASTCSQPSLVYTSSTSTRPLPPAVPETPLSGMYGEVALPRSSTDSDAPRSSIDSTSSFSSSSPSDTPVSPFSFPNSPSFEGDEFEATERLRSRWSSSTLGSLVVDPPRKTLLSPLRNVLGSRVRRVPRQKAPPLTPLRPTPSKLPKNEHGFPTTPSPPSTPGKHIRSRSSTSSAGTSSSECEGNDGSPSRLKRKPIPVSMFLRA